MNARKETIQAQIAAIEELISMGLMTWDDVRLTLDCVIDRGQARFSQCAQVESDASKTVH